MTNRHLIFAFIAIISSSSYAEDGDEALKNTKSKDRPRPQIECQPYPACLNDNYIVDGFVSTTESLTNTESSFWEKVTFSMLKNERVSNKK